MVAYLIFDGEHNMAPLFGVEPTGNHMRFSLLMLLTIKGDKIIEKRTHFDHADVEAQIKKYLERVVEQIIIEKGSILLPKVVKYPPLGSSSVPLLLREESVDSLRNKGAADSLYKGKS